MTKNKFCIPKYIENVSFHLMFFVKLAIWPKKCEEMDENYQKSHFFQISGILANFMSHIPLEMAKNTYSVPNYMLKVSFLLIYLKKFATQASNFVKNYKQ